MDNNLRTVKRDDLKNFVYDTFKSYGVCLECVNVDINSLYIRITLERTSADEDDINGINNALAELFKLNVISSNPEKIVDFFNGHVISLLHPFNIIN